MGCPEEAKVIDALLQAAVDLFNAPAQQRDPYSRANRLASAIPPVSKLADDWEAELRQRQPAKRRSGRPLKSEKDSATKVIAALNAHHGYGEGGSVTNPEPATNRGLAESYDLSANALSRFLAGMLGEHGHKRYEIACRNGKIGAMLALWNRELPRRHADLLPHESGREEDE
jgi:hypothetical protein